MNNAPTLNTLMMLQQKIMNKSKIRDIWTFVVMGSTILMLVPVLRVIIGLSNFVWMIAYIIIYFSIKNDKRILNALVRNLDPDEAPVSNQHQGFNLDPSISANWQHIFYNYHHNEVQNMLSERTVYNSNRDRWTFVYLITRFVLGFILVIGIFATGASLASTGHITDADISSKISSITLMTNIFLVIELLMIIAWVIIYITNYKKIKRINTQLMLWGLPNNNQQNQYNEQQQNQTNFT